jgi:hypothetical protein
MRNKKFLNKLIGLTIVSGLFYTLSSEIRTEADASLVGKNQNFEDVNVFNKYNNIFDKKADENNKGYYIDFNKVKEPIKEQEENALISKTIDNKTNNKSISNYDFISTRIFQNASAEDAKKNGRQKAEDSKKVERQKNK